MKYEKDFNELSLSRLTEKQTKYLVKQAEKLYAKVVVVHTQSIAIHKETGKRQKVEFESEYPYNVLAIVQRKIGDSNSRTMIGSLQIHLPSVHIRIKRIPRHWTP